MRANTLLKIAIALALPAVTTASALAKCPGKFTTEIVQYYSKSYPLPPSSQRDETAESICNIRTTNGQRVCEVSLWGVLFTPKSDKIFMQFPTIVFNHGSSETFDATEKYCALAQYFAPRGYMLFFPYRRGQGDSPKHGSSGTYIDNLKIDFAKDQSHHNTTCTTWACYKAELLTLQADEDVVYALNYLKLREQVRKDKNGDLVLAVAGTSYGGAVTVFFNRKDHGHKVGIAFAAAAQNWGDANFAYAAKDWVLSVERRALLGALLTAAKNSAKPAFYLQAEWDHDTRATIDLAYAHAYGSADPTHGDRFMASIFPYPKPDKIKGTNELKYSSVHTGFTRDPERWGPSVLAFFKLYGVE